MTAPLTREQRRDFRIVLRGFGIPDLKGSPLATSEEWGAEPVGNPSIFSPQLTPFP